jgi:hypothetical protein
LDTSAIPELSSLASAACSTYVLTMSEAHPAVSEIAALVGNPARANILMALIDGRALTASELAYVAGYRRRRPVSTSPCCVRRSSYR